MPDLITIAHRGSLQRAPENTVASIKQALKDGADMVAVDVSASKDDVPFLFADMKLDRTTNASGRFGDLTAKEIEELDAGSWHDAKFAGEKVPTLAEGLKAAGKKSPLMLVLPQLKDGSALFENVLKELKGREKSGDLLAFQDSTSLKAFREKAPEFSYALLLDKKVAGFLYLEKARSLNLQIVRPHAEQLTGRLVHDAHQRGLKVFAHFADEEDAMRELIEMRVDGIITGRPERLKKLLEEQKV